MTLDGVIDGCTGHTGTVISHVVQEIQIHKVVTAAVAIVEIKEGLECTEKEINDFCLALPRYKRPRKLFFDTVPRNPTGKIEKPALREKYCGKRLVEAQITG